jgi:uncharacterized protein
LVSRLPVAANWYRRPCSTLSTSLFFTVPFSIRESDPQSIFRVLLTLLVAWLGAQACLALHTPLPWTIGPLLASAALSMAGAPTLSWTPLRNLGQWTIGAALGLYFTPQVVALVAGLWWAIALNIVWALALGLLFGEWLYRLHAQPEPGAPWRTSLRLPALDRRTTYFAAPIGAASEMTLLGERHGAQTELVAASHSLRVLLVTLIIPFGFQWAGLQGLDFSPPAIRQFDAAGSALLAAATGAGCVSMVWARRTNPWFIGALAAAVLLTANGIVLSAIPQALLDGAQLVIGVSLGVRFTRSFVHQAPRWLASVAVATLLMLAACAVVAWGLAQAAGLHWATVLLGTSPGGIAEMAITAKLLQLGVPVVTAFHVTRLTAVLLLADPIYRWVYESRLTGTPPK